MRLHFQTGKLLKYSWDELKNFNFNWNIQIVLIGYSNKLISLRLFKGFEFEIDKYYYVLIFNKIIGRDWNRSNECRAMYEIMHEITRESKKEWNVSRSYTETKQNNIKMKLHELSNFLYSISVNIYTVTLLVPQWLSRLAGLLSFYTEEGNAKIVSWTMFK